MYNRTYRIRITGISTVTCIFQEDTMKITRVILIAVSLSCGILVVALLLVMVSSATAAREISLSKTITLSDSDFDRWQILPDMAAGRGDPGVVAVNNKIYVINGFCSPGYNYVGSQVVYDPQTATWQYLMSPPVPRSDFVAVNFGGKIYAIGGWNIDPAYPYGGVVDLNHMYDPVANTWITTTKPLPIPVSGAGGVVLNDKIYVIGGYTGAINTNIVQIYDPASDIWSAGTPMHSARSEFGAVVWNGLIYAIGGQSSIDFNDFEIYDPVSNLWSDGPALPERRKSMAVAVRQGKIYVIGGANVGASGVNNTMFVYDPGTNLWSTGDPMPTARHACRTAVISDKIYVIGGEGDLGAGMANEVYGLFPQPMYLPLVMR
jgi:N-acetylneuraminic acid mutarotase